MKAVSNVYFNIPLKYFVLVFALTSVAWVWGDQTWTVPVILFGWLVAILFIIRCAALSIDNIGPDDRDPFDNWEDVRP